MNKFYHPPHPVRCIITEISEGGKSYFPTNLFLNLSKNFAKYTFTHDLYIKIYIKN